jgi:hypothetical protein
MEILSNMVKGLVTVRPADVGQFNVALESRKAKWKTFGLLQQNVQS